MYVRFIFFLENIYVSRFVYTYRCAYYDIFLISLYKKNIIYIDQITPSHHVFSKKSNFKCFLLELRLNESIYVIRQQL